MQIRYFKSAEYKNRKLFSHDDCPNLSLVYIEWGLRFTETCECYLITK